MNYVFNVESQEEDNHGEIYFSSFTLSEAIKEFIEYSKNSYVTLEIYLNGIHNLTYGLLKTDNTTDENLIKITICDEILG